MTQDSRGLRQSIQIVSSGHVQRPEPVLKAGQASRAMPQPHVEQVQQRHAMIDRRCESRRRVQVVVRADPVGNSFSAAMMPTTRSAGD